MTNPIPVRFSQGQREEISEMAAKWNLSEQDVIRLSAHIGVTQLADFIKEKRAPSDQRSPHE